MRELFIKKSVSHPQTLSQAAPSCCRVNTIATGTVALSWMVDTFSHRRRRRPRSNTRVTMSWKRTAMCRDLYNVATRAARQRPASSATSTPLLTQPSSKTLSRLTAWAAKLTSIRRGGRIVHPTVRHCTFFNYATAPTLKKRVGMNVSFRF